MKSVFLLLIIFTISLPVLSQKLAFANGKKGIQTDFPPYIKALSQNFKIPYKLPHSKKNTYTNFIPTNEQNTFPKCNYRALKYGVLNKVSVKTGAYAGVVLLLGKELVTPSTPENISLQKELVFKEKDYLNRLDYGLILGLEYNLKAGVFLETIYNLGLKDFDADTQDYEKNGFIQLGLGYKF